MGLKQIFIDIQTSLNAIQATSIISPTPSKTKNYVKTDTNANNYFKYVNVFDHQMDDLIKGTDGYAIKNPSVYIEFIPGECKMLLNKVSSYPESKVCFHIYSMILNSGDLMEQNLDIYDCRDKLKQNILNLSPDGCSSFMCYEDRLDYKHGNISKYLLSFNFNYMDQIGSVFDPNSVNYLKAVTLSGTFGLNKFNSWYQGVLYTENINVVIIDGVVYLCKVTNSDQIFTIANWQICTSWLSGNSYMIGVYIYLNSNIYRCSTANSDSTFTPANWEFITH